MMKLIINETKMIEVIAPKEVEMRFAVYYLDCCYALFGYRVSAERFVVSYDCDSRLHFKIKELL